MNVDIYIKEKYGPRLVRIPWLPESIAYESGGTVRATYDILDRGPVEVPTGSGLTRYSWKSQFPGKYRGTGMYMMRGTWEDPSVYHNIFEDWKKKRTVLVILITGYPFNTDVILDDYKSVATGAFGDIEYEVSFLEHRDITIQSTVVETPPARATTEAASGGTYTVKSGDNLWDIAQAKLGKGSRNMEIYELNKDIIESTAKKNGKKSSNNGWWIYPSTVLTLPAK